MEVQAALRRVRKAPHAYTISEPPPWYTQWLRDSLRKRAREIMTQSEVGDVSGDTLDPRI